MRESENPKEGAREQRQGVDGTERRVVSADELLDGHREVWLRHGTDLYRLLVTRNGKLLLQK